MEIVKAYGRIMPTGYGIPTLILTGWVDETHIYAESFLILETRQGAKRSSKSINVAKDQWEDIQQYLKKPANNEELIETFMDQALRLAQGDLFGMMVDMWEEKESTAPIDTDLVEGEPISTVLHVKDRFPNELDRIEKSTRQKRLQGMIKTAKGITYYRSDERQ